MVSSKTKYIGTGATVGILGLLGWFVLTGIFQVQMEGDIKCDGTFQDICDWHFNITNTGVTPYYLYNKNAVALTFEPDVKQFWLCKKDGRYSGKARENRELYPCGVGYKEFWWNESLTSSASYVEKFSKGDKKEYKIAILKHNPKDKIKFGGNLAVEEFDPFLLPRDINVSWLCSYRTEQTNTTIDVKETTTKEFTCPVGKNASRDTVNKRGFCWNIHEWGNGSTTRSINFSHFYDVSVVANRTMYWEETNFLYSYVEIENETHCDHAGIRVDDKTLNFSKCGVQCSWDNPIFQCDTCDFDGNCDGIKQNGESGISIDISEDGWKRMIKEDWKVGNGNSKLRNFLGDCVE